MQYVNTPEIDLGKGIDVRSAENQIQPGFVLDLLNADVIEKRVRKRAGYQGYAGNVPVRVTRLDYIAADTDACFTLDSAISLDTIRSTPIIVYGRSSNQATGPFTTAGSTAQYYPSFTIPTRKMLTAPSGTLIIEGAEHGFGTTSMYVGIVESLSTSDRSYTTVLTDSLSVDSTTFDISIGYTTSVDRNVYVYYADKTSVAGQSYVTTLSHTGSGSETFSIPASTHNLVNFNITSAVRQLVATDPLLVVPEQLLLATNGDVSITLVSSAATTYSVVLSAAPIINEASGVVDASSTGTVTISAPTVPWVFPAIYLEQTPNGIKELVYPDSILYDATTNNITISFTNDNTTARNFIVFYEYGETRSNKLCVTDALATVNGTDLSPQLTLWGLDHTEIYGDKSVREGWVTHIDSYKRSGEQRIISGLGGNLFSAQEYDEASAPYLFPTLYPDLNTRTASNKVLGPTFWVTGNLPARSRGYITADSLVDHEAVITSVAYNTGTGYTVYTLSLPNKQILDSSGGITSLASVISTTTNLQDHLTVSGMSWAVHEGTFRIRQVTDGTNQILVYVENENNSSDFDDSGTAGCGSILTDQFTWSATSPFVPGDILSASAVTTDLVNTVVSGVGAVTVSSGFTDTLEVPGGVLFNATRTSSIIPLREAAPSLTSSVENLVRGDMLSYTDIARLLRIEYINTDADRTVNLVANGTTLTGTLTSGTTSFLSVGKTILLLNAGSLTGEYTVSNITSGTVFTAATSLTETVTGATLAGNTVEVDEELEWRDTPGDQVSFRVEERWIPIEGPTDSYTLTEKTHPRYFDRNPYIEQSFLRSTMVVDNMYLTNGDDTVQKLDGTSIYRAGLPDWQPGLFVTQETTGATIVTDLRNHAYSAIVAVEGKLTVTAATTGILPVGANVKLSGSSRVYSVREYINDGTNYYLLLNKALDSGVSASGTVSEVGYYRYYFRLNMVDANNNVIASAATGSQDHVVEMTGNAAIQLALAGLPALDNYDYDRIEIQIYRTILNVSEDITVAPTFYLVTTLPVSFDNAYGYIQFRDSFADSDLRDLDPVHSALKGSELGTGWTDPLRAKYITSVNNKTVLANLRGYPQLDIQVVGDATLSNSSFAGDSILFRKDNTDAGTTTDMVNRVRFEWVNGTTGTVSAPTILTNQFQFTTSSATSAVIGDWIYLTYASVASTARQLNYSGWWQIAAISGTTVTVNVIGATAAASYPNRYVIATDPTDVPVLLGTDGNLGMFNGDSFDTFDSMRRMSMAINSVMRMTDITVTGMSEFRPWLTCRGGNDVTPAGRLLVKQSIVLDTTVEMVPTFSGYSLFVNNVRRTTGDQISASTRLLQSRLIASYQNYPEIFDNPTAILDVDSQAAVDVNSADGQEITGIIPFFGQTAFTAAQQAAILVVFKSNSIYLVDLNEKDAGRNPIQKIETEGLGCTAPYSIAVTKNGIMFANDSGMYCLRKNQSIQYVGKYMERNWTEQVSLPDLSMAHGHHFGIGRAYKLSVPLASTTTSLGYNEPTEAYVYNHTAEDLTEEGLGAWARYDNHPVVGWANLGSDAFLASTNGRVFSLRNTGLESDYRDSNDSIHFLVKCRPNDFGNAAIRKVLDTIVGHYRSAGTSVGTTLSFSVDFEDTYTTTTPFTVNATSRAVATISHNISRRRGTFFSIQIENSTIDEGIELAGLDFKVGGLGTEGIVQASQTR